MYKGVLFGVTLLVAACGFSWPFFHTPVVQAAKPDTPLQILPVPQILSVPHNYREWVYLTSGLDMTYVATDPSGPTPNHDGEFDNVFVNSESYRDFLQSGTWPNSTVFVLENRSARRNVSTNKGGRTQGTEVTGVELHVKTGNHWAFYAREEDGREHLIVKPANYYSCHEAHAAVDTTFVQFYPTLLPVAQVKGTLSSSYIAETAASAAK